MRARFTVAARFLLQTAIAVCMPGGAILVIAYHVRRWRKAKAMATASIPAP